MPSGEGGGTVATSAVASPRASSSSGTNGAASSPSAQVAMEGERRTGRSGSVVVYPEDEDAGKPKVFARQSFVVCGEEEEMAETILQARQLAGQRRRSTFDADGKGEGVDKKQQEIAKVAQNLAARRDSLTPPGPGVDAAASAAAAGATAAAAGAASTDKDAAARRRSSVMKLPENLRALVQQSDASGVQQKSVAPYQPQASSSGGGGGGGGNDNAQTTPTTQGTTSLNNTGSSTASTGGSTGWMSNVLAFIRWKKLPRRKGSKGQVSKEGKGGVGTRDGGGATPGVSPDPGKGFARKTRPLLPKQLPEFAGRKQLVLDLDETLVHSSFKPVAGADFIMDIMVDGTFYKVFVLKRPGVDEFLERVSKLYEVIIFTASLPQYANPLLDLLDPKGTITSRLFREHCTFHEGYFVKDLTLLRHQSLESTIIVDNSPMAYMFQPENAIDCMSWIDERDDTELNVIADFLETIIDVPDVRDLLEFWREGAAVLDNVG